jgi:hypothetical protein
LEILLISVDVWGAYWPRLEPLDEQLVIWCGGKLWVALGNCHVRTRISRQPKSQLSVLYGRAAGPTTKPMFFRLSEEGVPAIDDQDGAGHER